jgi:phage-related protein
LNLKLSALKADIKKAETIEKDTEIKFLKSTVRSKVAEIKLVMKEKDIRRTLHAVQFAESVTLHLFDCTGSMAPYISSVKDSIKSIVDRVLATNQDTNLRLAIVGYRNINDSPRCEVLDFITSIGSFKEFLAGLNATGGDDAPEDMANEIQETNKLSWANPSKSRSSLPMHPAMEANFIPVSILILMEHCAKP